MKLELDPPARWPDSRLAGEVAVTLDAAIDRGLDPAVEREWRQAAFAAFYEQVDLADAVAHLFHDFERRGHFGTHGVASIDDLAAGRRLAAATRGAVAAGVEGAPTLMFDAFPLCGIHDEATMLGMIQRYARRRRRPEAPSAVGVN